MSKTPTMGKSNMPFPDIALYGKGYSTNVRDSIRAYKHPIVSTKTQAQLHAEIASNVASHRIKWSEAEVHRAVKNRVDDADDADDATAAVVAVEEGDDDASVDDTATFGEEDADVASVNEETTVAHEATPQEKAATSEEKANALFTAAGYTENSIPKDVKGLKKFLSDLRKADIIRMYFVTNYDAAYNRRRLLAKLNLAEAAPTHFTTVAPS